MTLTARLRCAESHVAAVRRMIEEGAPCSAVLLQLRAVQGSVAAVGRLLVAKEIQGAMREQGATEAVRLAEELGAVLLTTGCRIPGREASTVTRHRERRAPCRGT